MLPQNQPQIIHPSPESFYGFTEDMRRHPWSDPARWLTLRQLRCYGRAVLFEAERMEIYFRVLAKWIRRHRIKQKVWRSEMEFIGFRVGNRPIKGQKIRLHANVGGVRIIIETE